jgi:hypothetical protein
MASSIAAVMSTSPTSGAFRMVLGPSPSIAATMCLVTAFFDPRTEMSPRSGPDGSTCHVSSILPTVGAAAGGPGNSREIPEPATRECATVIRPGGELGILRWAPSGTANPSDRKSTPMAPTLDQILLTPENQPNVVVDCLKLIDQEVSDKHGVSGAAVKIAYKTAKTFAKGYLQSTVETLLPDFVAALEPFWADFTASGSSGFGDYLVKRSDEVSEALLAITDARAKNSDRPVIIRAYGTVRGGAAKHIAAALPAVGAMVEKYASLA